MNIVINIHIINKNIDMNTHLTITIQQPAMLTNE